MKTIAALLTVVALAAGVGATRVGLERLVEQGPREQTLLYLPHPTYLKVLSLGQAPVLADVIYLWSIQFYSDYEREDRYEFVEHIFAEVIPELDPNYVDPYWLGALILIVEVGELDRGLALLDLGFERNPESWVLPYFAAWEAERAGKPELAASYFAKASAVESAPDLVHRMRAGMLGRAGRIDDAIRAWEEVRDDPEGNDGSRAIAQRWIYVLWIRRDVASLQRAVEAFRAKSGRNPLRLDELVEKGFVGAVPVDPFGGAYDYDPATGEVSSRTAFVLGDR